MTEKLSFKLPTSMGELSEKTKEVSEAIESYIGHKGARMFTSPNSEIKDVTDKDRFISAALSGLFSLATTPIISKYLLKNKKLSIPMTIANTATGIASGYFAPDISNVIKREVKGYISPEDARSQIIKLESPRRKTLDKTNDIINKYLDKEAGIAGGAAGLIRKTITGTSGLLWKGIRPRSGIARGAKTPLHRKALALGVRGGIGADAMYGGYRGVKSLSGPRSGKNYTTMLRNNILAGKVQPSELSQADMISVKKLGLR